MVFTRLNLKVNQVLCGDTADLKKDVFINLRKQTRQKMEGISACQF